MSQWDAGAMSWWGNEMLKYKDGSQMIKLNLSRK